MLGLRENGKSTLSLLTLSVLASCQDMHAIHLSPTVLAFLGVCSETREMTMS